MRLLFLTPQSPYPPHGGGPLRALGLIAGLHQAGCEIDLLTFVEEGQPDPATTPLSEFCRQIISVSMPKRSSAHRLRDLLAGKVDMISRFHTSAYGEALNRVLNSAQASGKPYDAIQAEGLEVAAYLPRLKTSHPHLNLIYGSTNAEFELQRVMYLSDRRTLRRLPVTLYSLIQWRRLIHFERWICQSSDQVIATSQPDADAFARLAPEARISVVPNGIDVNEYMQPSAQLELGSAALLFTGTMDYRPNVDAALWFADQILVRVRAAVPEARLFIVGRSPHPRLDVLRQRPDIELTGYVQDIRPFLNGCAVYIVPLRMGAGTRLKLLQAMAASRAIVSTTMGAQGLDVTSGREMILADDAATFAQSVITLLRDPARRDALGRAAQTLVCERYDWSVLIPRMVAVYREMGIG